MATSDLFSFLGDPSPARKVRGGRRRPRAALGADAATNQVHLLDVGTEQYGDCVLMELAGVTVLIDGGHRSNINAQGSAPSIPTQIEKLLGKRPPFKIDLLVVSHCHSDHLGCLPELVSQHLIDVRWALVIDEKLGFPHTFGSDARMRDGPASRLIAALFEEKRPASMSDAELEQFLQDAATMGPRYRGMLTTLQGRNTKIVRHGRSSTAAIEKEFSKIGLEILGPSREQLKLCRDYLMRVGTDAADHLSARAEVQDLAGEAHLYREIVARWTSADEMQDRVGPGSGKNDQSLVLKFTVGAVKLLFTGDMQFAEAEVSGLESEMKKLRKAVENAGPYTFVKIAHHGSYNAFDQSVLTELGTTKAFATQNGTNDATHPSRPVLALLKAHRQDLDWARTDRNGSVTVTFPSGVAKMKPSRGRLNDATPNGDVGTAVSTLTPAGVPLSVEHGAVGTAEFNASARVSDRVGEVTVTFTTRPADGLEPAAPEAATSPEDGPLAGGRRLPPLLFVTHGPALAANIGREEARRAMATIRASGQTLLDVQHPSAPFAEVSRALAGGTYKGVVLVGGYDVLPAQRLDALSPALRRALGPDVVNDADQYFVWSDAIYGDDNADKLPELPVSRVPDGKSPQLLMAALTAKPGAGNPGRRFGVRNVARPFATPIYNQLRGNGRLLVSEPTTSSRIGAGGAAGDARYFMLHGSDSDATTFWGEDDDDMVEALTIANLPNTNAGVIFTGCCWGALIVDTIALNATNGRRPAPRVPESSIALSALRNGALAFIGCTGTHYSPTEPPYDYFGGPMHRAFWKHYYAGKAPAEALFAAKLDYVAGMPHGQTRADARAIEMKILRQYTCLGLGW